MEPWNHNVIRVSRKLLRKSSLRSLWGLTRRKVNILNRLSGKVLISLVVVVVVVGNAC